MSLIEKSLEIALKAYAGQTDKAGAPYILHPILTKNSGGGVYIFYSRPGYRVKCKA